MEELSLSKNVANLRKKKGVTQETLAEFIGVTKASVSKWETGQSMPDVLILPKLASFFDVSVDELLAITSIDERENQTLLSAVDHRFF